MRLNVLKKIAGVLKEKLKYRHPDTFAEELDCQCKIFLKPAAVLGLIVWIPFLVLDRVLYPGIPSLIYLRLGLSFVGLTELVLNVIPIKKPGALLSKYKNYILLIFLISYLMLSTGFILGLVRADPVYMGGYGIVLLGLPLSPIKMKHSFILLGSSLLIFMVVGLHCGMNFETALQQYGLFNLTAAVTMVVLGVIILGYIRRNSYYNNLLIQRKSDERIGNFLRDRGVSKREAEIVHLIMLGKSNNEIEDKLFISLTTVKSHIYNVYRKLGVKNRVQLANTLQKISKEW